MMRQPSDLAYEGCGCCAVDPDGNSLHDHSRCVHPFCRFGADGRHRDADPIATVVTAAKDDSDDLATWIDKQRRL